MENKKTVVITGSTSGLGKELTKLFAQSEEFFVFAGYRNIDKIEQNSNKIEYFYMDLCDDKSIIEAANFIKSKADKVDILINAAGAVVAGPVECLNVKNLREQFQVNTFAHIEFTQQLMPILDGARIVNISSMSSFGHFPFISPYCASKRSLDIFFNALALETHKNLEIVSVKPGVIATPIWEKSVKSNTETLENNKEYEKELEFLKNNALKNTNKGLNVSDAAQKIKEIATKKKVKPSYLLGKDSVVASILSHLPQGILNKLVKHALSIKMSKYGK